jgi:dihydroflavonol-4-reductase
MKVAITGASGHIGNTLCKELLDRGYKIKALLHNDEDDLKKPGIELVKGNILDKGSLDKLCKEADVVFHLAARISIDNKDRKEIFEVNVQGTQNIIDACIKNDVKRLVHFSSIHTLSHKPYDEVLDETRPMIDKTHIAYEQSKTEGEKLVHKAIEKGLDAVIIVPTAIIGPYDFKPSLLGQALMKIYQNKLPMLVEGGYDWVDVRDVADGAINASTMGEKGERYILSGKFMELGKLSALIGQLTGQKTPGFTAPSILARIGLPFIKLYAYIMNEHPLYTGESLDILKSSNRNISNEKAGKTIGYKSRPLEETIVDTFEWYKQNGMVE